MISFPWVVFAAVNFLRRNHAGHLLTAKERRKLFLRTKVPICLAEARLICTWTSVGVVRKLPCFHRAASLRLANCKNGKPLSDNKILKVRRFLKHFTVEQPIRELALRPDRADVIIPALDIYLKIMKWAGIRKIYVPQIGLADGIVQILYNRYKTSNSQSSNREV